MSILVKLPFNLTFGVTKLTLHLAAGRLGFLTAGAILGWYAHKRYGNMITEGVSADIVALWRKLDANCDGKVSLDEFKTGVKSQLGKFAPSDDVLAVLYVHITEACKVIDANGDGKFSNDELLAFIKAKLSWIA